MSRPLLYWILLLAGTNAIAEETVQLTHEELKILHEETVVMAGASARGIRYFAVHYPDGTANLRYLGAFGKIEAREGSWRMDDDSLCTTWGNLDETCNQFYRDGDRLRYRRRGSDFAVGYVYVLGASDWLPRAPAAPKQ